MKAKSFEANKQLFIDPAKLLPLSRFLPQPPGAKRIGGRGGGRGGARGRGGPRGGGGFRGGRGAPRAEDLIEEGVDSVGAVVVAVEDSNFAFFLLNPSCSWELKVIFFPVSEIKGWNADKPRRNCPEICLT